jgi:hypothetical protein
MLIYNNVLGDFFESASPQSYGAQELADAATIQC